MSVASVDALSTLSDVRAAVGGEVRLPKKYREVHVALRWDAFSAATTDLDLSMIALDREGKVRDLDVVYQGRKKNSNLSALHSGDLQEGSIGDAERITIDMWALPAEVYYLAFTVHRFSGSTFDHLRGTALRVGAIDERKRTHGRPQEPSSSGLDPGEKQMMWIPLKSFGSNRGAIVVVLARSSLSWRIHPVLQPLPKEDFGETLPVAEECVRALGLDFSGVTVSPPSSPRLLPKETKSKKCTVQ